MTPQEVFDKAVTHLLTQMKKSGMNNENGEFECLYRGPNGLMCGAGPFIPDEVYHPSMENVSISGVISDNAKLGHLEPHRRLLADIQSIHDNDRVENWSENLADLAKLRQLTFNPPNPEPST